MPTVLLADDHPATRSLLTERLTLDGYEVVVAEDSAGAWERLATARPDLVLASVALPPGEGGHLLQRLRTSGAGRPVPSIVYDLAHRGEAKGMPAVLPLGANGYVPDPTRHEALKEKIVALLSAAPRRRAPGVEPPVTGERPLAQGELGPGALTGTLLRMAKDGIDGTLHLAPAGGDVHRIAVSGGRVVGVSSPDPEASLLKWLVDAGRIDGRTYDAALELTARDGLSPTGALVAEGALEPGPALVKVLEAHAAALVVRWSGLRTGSWRLLAADEAETAGPPIALPLLPLVRGASEAQDPVSVWQAALADHMDAYPYRDEGFRSRFDAMALSPKEVAFAMKIGGETRTRDLLAASSGELKAALLLLGFFHRLGVVAFSPAPRRSADAGVYQATPVATRKKKPLPEAEAERLTEEALRIVTASYFGVLGVDIAADVEEVEQAYHDVATRFHPDSFAEFDLEGIEDLLQTVLDRAGAAYRVLSVPEKRGAYLAYLVGRYQTRRRNGPIVPEAEVALCRGLKRLKTRDAVGAVQAFEEAVRINPKEPAYLVHQAFALFLAGRGAREARAKEPRKIVKKALALDPAHDQAILVLTLLDEAAGDRDGARAQVLSLLKARPDHSVAKAVLQFVNRT